MKISDAGVALIKEFEGCELTAYPDPATGGDPWTVGIGHTGPEVRPGMTITETEAEDILRADLQAFERCVNNATAGIAITQGQFDALVAFSFNVGCANLKSSTLLRKLRSGDEDGAAQEFARWNRANGAVMKGLTRRREAERALFLS